MSNQGTDICGWWVGPIWKSGGETCVCMKAEGHDETEGHTCSCGTSFFGCGHPKGARA